MGLAKTDKEAEIMTPYPLVEVILEAKAMLKLPSI